ncbi:MAG: helix-turn-helix transcriptional regulator [Gorillibacterium sp.]|nr:helix-turn-helix transcriptional regulator [Gorillibacterium sp.]
MFTHHYLPTPAFNQYICYPEWIGQYNQMPNHQVYRPIGLLKTFNLHLVFSGKGYVQNAKQRYELNAGTGFLYDMCTVQNYGADERDPWDVRWVHFHGAGIENLLGSEILGEKCWKFHFTRRDHLGKLMDEMMELCNPFQTEHEIRLSTLLYELLIDLRIHAEPWNTTVSNSDRERLHRSAEYIRLHYAEDISLANIAKVADYSPSHFSRTFHRTMGRTPVQYLNETRIIIAKQLLASGTLPVKEIALATGFQQSSYFIKRFHQHEGVTPQQYRAMHSFR